MHLMRSKFGVEGSNACRFPRAEKKPDFYLNFKADSVLYVPSSLDSGAKKIELRVSGVGFRVSGFGCRVSGVGSQVSRVSGVGCQVSGSGLRVSGWKCQVSGVGFRMSGFG